MKNGKKAKIFQNIIKAILCLCSVIIMVTASQSPVYAGDCGCNNQCKSLGWAVDCSSASSCWYDDAKWAACNGHAWMDMGADVNNSTCAICGAACIASDSYNNGGGNGCHVTGQKCRICKHVRKKYTYHTGGGTVVEYDTITLTLNANRTGWKIGDNDIKSYSQTVVKNSSATFTGSVSVPTSSSTDVVFTGYFTGSSDNNDQLGDKIIDASGKFVGTGYTISGNTTLYAHYSPTEYSVKFCSNNPGVSTSDIFANTHDILTGGYYMNVTSGNLNVTVMDAKSNKYTSVTSNNAFANPPNVAWGYKGKKFLGWFTQASGGNQVSRWTDIKNRSDVSKEGNTYKVYAHWADCNRDVYLKIDGGNIIDGPYTVKYGESRNFNALAGGTADVTFNSCNNNGTSVTLYAPYTYTNLYADANNRGAFTITSTGGTYYNGSTDAGTDYIYTKVSYGSVTAPTPRSLSGQVFDYWTNGVTTLKSGQTYTYVPGGNNTFTPVYKNATIELNVNVLSHTGNNNASLTWNYNTASSGVSYKLYVDGSKINVNTATETTPISKSFGDYGTTYSIPTAGLYTITAHGGKGGGLFGHNGAKISAKIWLKTGDIVGIYCGQSGNNGGNNWWAQNYSIYSSLAGGGTSTYWIAPAPTNWHVGNGGGATAVTLNGKWLLVAGGGSGSAQVQGIDGNRYLDNGNIMSGGVSNGANYASSYDNSFPVSDSNLLLQYSWVTCGGGGGYRYQDNNGLGNSFNGKWGYITFKKHYHWWTDAPGGIAYDSDGSTVLGAANSGYCYADRKEKQVGTKKHNSLNAASRRTDLDGTMTCPSCGETISGNGWQNPGSCRFCGRSFGDCGGGNAGTYYYCYTCNRGYSDYDFNINCPADHFGDPAYPNDPHFDWDSNGAGSIVYYALSCTQDENWHFNGLSDATGGSNGVWWSDWVGTQIDSTTAPGIEGSGYADGRVEIKSEIIGFTDSRGPVSVTLGDTAAPDKPTIPSITQEKDTTNELSSDNTKISYYLPRVSWNSSKDNGTTHECKVEVYHIAPGTQLNGEVNDIKNPIITSGVKEYFYKITQSSSASVNDSDFVSAGITGGVPNTSVTVNKKVLECPANGSKTETWYLFVYAKDAAGNKSELARQTLTVSYIYHQVSHTPGIPNPPNVSVTNASDWWVYNSSGTQYYVNTKQGKRIGLTVSGSLSTVNKGFISGLYLTTGSERFGITRDAKNNASIMGSLGSYISPPSLSAPSGSTSSNSFSGNYVVSGEGTVTLGTKICVDCYGLYGKGCADSNHKQEATGNSVTVVGDATDPGITIGSRGYSGIANSNTFNYEVSDSTTISASISDNGAGIKSVVLYKGDKSSHSTVLKSVSPSSSGRKTSENFSYSCTQGMHTYYLEATDNVGNVTGVTITTTSENAPPIISDYSSHGRAYSVNSMTRYTDAEYEQRKVTSGNGSISKIAAAWTFDPGSGSGSARYAYGWVGGNVNLSYKAYGGIWGWDKASGWNDKLYSTISSFTLYNANSSFSKGSAIASGSTENQVTFNSKRLYCSSIEQVISTEGETFYVLEASDGGYNEKKNISWGHTAALNISVKIDKSAPVITFDGRTYQGESSSNTRDYGWATENITKTFSISDQYSGIRSVTVTEGGNNLLTPLSYSSRVTSTGNQTLTISSEGYHTIVITAIDNVGYKSVFTVKTFKLDKTPAKITDVSGDSSTGHVGSNPSGSWKTFTPPNPSSNVAYWTYDWIKGSRVLSFTTTDNIAKITSFKLYSSNSSWDIGSALKTGTKTDDYNRALLYTVSKEGITYYVLESVNEAGLKTYVRITVRVDASAPTVTWAKVGRDTGGGVLSYIAPDENWFAKMTPEEINNLTASSILQKTALTFECDIKDSNLTSNKTGVNDSSGIWKVVLTLMGEGDENDSKQYEMSMYSVTGYTAEKNCPFADLNGTSNPRVYEAVYRTSVNTLKEFPDSGYVTFSITATDNTGNTRTVQAGTILNFGVKAIIHAVKDDAYNTVTSSGIHLGYFKTGEIGYVEVWTIGYVDYLSLDFKAIGEEMAGEISNALISEKYKLGFLTGTDEDKRIVTNMSEYKKEMGVSDNNGNPFMTHFVYNHPNVENDTNRAGWLSSGTNIRIPLYHSLTPQRNGDGSTKVDDHGNILYAWETHSADIYAGKESKVPTNPDKYTKDTSYYVIWDDSGDDLHYRITHETPGTETAD